MRTTRVTLRGNAVISVAIAVLLPLGATGVMTQSAPSAPAAATKSADAATLEALERKVEAAYQQADQAFLKATLADDFRFTHASGTVAGKADTMASFARPGNFLSRTLTSVEAEVHGNIALTIGRIEVRPAGRPEYTVCYVRLYERRTPGWQLVSHRTFREQTGVAESCAPR